MLTREVDPRIVMSLDVLLKDKSPFDILSVGFVFGDQYRTLLSVQFECEPGARFYGAFCLRQQDAASRIVASHTKG